MTEFRHILFPVDFSERSLAARPFVRALARRFHARVSLLHVLGVPQGFYGGIDASYPISIDWEAMKADSAARLATFLPKDEHFQEEVNVASVVGEPAMEIASYAAQNDVDLIAMPTHGYGPFREFLLGSVTAKILHDAHCPVWTAAHTDSPELGTHVKLERIMCAVDNNTEGIALMHRAAELAEKLSARVWLVHAVPEVDFSPMNRFDGVFRADIIRMSQEAIKKLQEEAGTDFNVCLEMGPVSKVVQQAALHHEADLVLMGRGKMHGRLARLRSNGYAIVRDAPCPVLSF